MSFEQKQVVTNKSQNCGTSGNKYVIMDREEIIRFLQDIEGVKRRLLNKLNGG